MPRLRERVAIVTGAASGIGRATARLMAEEGASIVAADINGEGAERVAAEVTQTGGRAIGIRVDIGNNDEVRQMVERAVAHFGRVDIMVNGAARIPVPEGPIEERNLADMENEISVTLIGAIRCCRAVVPYMIKQNSGRIINVCSDGGKGGSPSQSIYAASKAGLTCFSKSIAAELGSRGVTVNCVSPGAIKTPAMLQYLAENPAREEFFLARVPLRRLGEPEDIAHMIIFLASDDAAYITGQDYSVNGGSRM
jgi:NAD(P)-dependent dehydrogenase (short-subunit alcohol dehydrogenase family)